MVRWTEPTSGSEWSRRNWRADALDPCAGDGAALLALRARWRLAGRLKLHLIEMEATRAHAARGRIERADDVFHGDAFRISWEQRRRDDDDPAAAALRGAALLYLNPPYDSDEEHGRLERRWLARFAPLVASGGVLMFIVPVAAIRACADVLALRFTDLQCYRFPPGEFEAFRQVVIVGRRSPVVRAGAPRDRIFAWAERPEALPVLGGGECFPLVVPVDPERFVLPDLHAMPLDAQAVAEEWRPWKGEPVGVDLGVDDLIGRTFPTALPPKPAHLALALAAGHFNGHRLIPNEPAPEWPPIIIKGSFHRERVEVDKQLDERGRQTASIQVEQPRLRLSGLRLDLYTFFRPAAGSEPSGAGSIEDANAADVVMRYSRALSELMARQFPPLHDPHRREDCLRLPDLPRRPYVAQYHGIQAALKLLATRRHPKFLSEVGTGKTTMATTIAAALHPIYHAATAAEVARVLGPSARLPVVERTLVLCPPHLLDTWRGQIREVWPRARVQVVKTPNDLRADAEFFILSREVAKLGHGVAGVSRCPRCGARQGLLDAAKAAKLRAACSAVRHRPSGPWARWAEELAAVVLRVDPSSDNAAKILAERYPVLRRAAERAAAADHAARKDGRIPPARRLPSGAVGGLLRSMCRVLLNSLLKAGYGAHGDFEWKLPGLIADIAFGAGEPAAGVHFLGLVAQRAQAASVPSGRLQYTTVAAEGLKSRQEGDRLEALQGALRSLAEKGTWETSAPCGERLWWATPDPRRFPLARFITRRMPRRFDLLVLDEAHEFNNLGTAQQKAAHRLVELGIPTLALTGSVMGGYASSLFANWWALDRDFRREFERDDKGLFMRRYGLGKYLVKVDERVMAARKKPAEFGAVTDREETTEAFLGEIPGVVPLFLLRHVLPAGVVIHVDDLSLELPVKREARAALGPETEVDDEILEEYRRLERELMEQIRADAFTPLAGKLWGAMGELPSYLDRCTDDQGAFELRYPEDVGGMLVAEGALFPASFRTPKERWLADLVRRECGAGRRVAVFLRHTGTPHLAARLSRILAEDVDLGGRRPKVVWLDAKKVPTEKREEWINTKVLAPPSPADVLLVNPNAVRTGLNNLVAFSVAAWYEVDYNAQTYRQANGRFHRPGQKREVDVFYPFYAETSQEDAVDLVARKVTASLQVDGLDVQGALEAAGAGEEGPGAGLELAMQMGQAIHARIAARAAAARSR